MGIAFSNLTLEPICDCCDNFVKYVLNGCKSECGFSKCCVCKIEVMNHSADEFIEPEGEQSKRIPDDIRVIAGDESRETNGTHSYAIRMLAQALSSSQTTSMSPS